MMVDTVFLTTGLLAQLAQKVAGSDTLSTLIDLLTDRAKTAVEKHQKEEAVNGDPLEAYRDQVIRRITELRNRAALRIISEPELQQKIWCLLMEQTITTYEATTKRGLDFVSANTEQVEAALNSYERALAYRRNVSLLAVIVSLVSLGGLGIFLYFANINGMRPEVTLPILGIPTCILLWSVVGSFAAILYRFTNAGDKGLEDPLKWLFARPLTGVIMGAITFLVIKAGFLTMSPGQQPSNLGTNEVMLLVAFLAGFSDRFADTLLRSLVGRFGGEKSGELVSLEVPSGAKTTSMLNTFGGLLGRNGNLRVSQEQGDGRLPAKEASSSLDAATPGHSTVNGHSSKVPIEGESHPAE